jgi:hypothetical protein
LLILSAAAEANGGNIQNFFMFASDDHPDVSLRPQLTVEFTLVPEPSGLVTVALGVATAIAAGGFRRRR